MPAKFHQAEILRQHMQPAFEILYFKFWDFHNELLEYAHHCILSILFVFQILEGNAIYKVQIAIVQNGQCFSVAFFRNKVQEILVGPLLVIFFIPVKLHR